MKIYWATDYFSDGNAYGYSVQNQKSRDALAATGVEFDKDAEIAVHAVPGHLFEPVPDKINVLYCALETPDVPGGHIKGYKKADYMIVISRFVQDAVRRAVPEIPVYLCHLGVDVDKFTFQRRHYPRFVPFRFLYVGAPNARKGWELIREAWRIFCDEPGVELYIKTTVTEKRERHGNIIFDSRNLSLQQLVELYHSAHCFLYPTFGEGFGLTMAEAMATGLPCIYTNYSAMRDYADASVAYPLRYELQERWLTPNGGIEAADSEPLPGSIRTTIAQADLKHLAETMYHIWKRYPKAARKGERAAERIRSGFTWGQTGRRLKEILEEVSGVLAEVA